MPKKLLVIAFCIFFANNSWGKTPLKVAVFPFSVNSREQLDYLQEGISAMLATRMEQDKEITTIDKHVIKSVLPAGKAKLDERLARSLGGQVGADFAIMGSFTKIGNGASIDTIILDTTGKRAAQHVFVQCATMENVNTHIGLLARQLDFALLGKQLLARIDIKGNRYIEKDAIKFVITS